MMKHQTDEIEIILDRKRSPKRWMCRYYHDSCVSEGGRGEMHDTKRMGRDKVRKESLEFPDIVWHVRNSQTKKNRSYPAHAHQTSFSTSHLVYMRLKVMI